MTRNLDPAVDLIETFEGCVLHAYRDVVGVWTIGYGTTAGVHQGMVITREQALEFMQSDVAGCAAKILAAVSVPLLDTELSALVSFVYNVGIGAFDSSTLLAKLNAKDPKTDVANEFLKWIHAGHRVISGLVRRRKAERELFLCGAVTAGPVLKN